MVFLTIYNCTLICTYESIICYFKNEFNSYFILCQGCQKPTSKECVLLVKPKYMNVWFELGALLNMPEKRLQDIKVMEQNDSDLCCTRMFMEWENSSNPTWSKLKSAMSCLFISLIKNTG